MQYKVTVFKSISSEIPIYYDVLDVLSSIKRGKNSELIDKIRTETDKEKRDRLKKQLYWICFSGEFKKRHNSELVEHSGLICIDFDNFTNKQTLNMWKNKLKADKYCFSVFVSPSGNGLKLLMKIPKCATNEEHNLRFDAIADYFSECSYFDKNGKGVVRVCYESFDPDIYVNSDSILFNDIKVQVKTGEQLSFPTLIEDMSSFEIFSKLTKWFEGKYNLKKGNRNESLFYFASACRDYNIPENTTFIMLSNYASSHAEHYESIKPDVPIIIKSAYSHPSKNKKMQTIAMVDKASEQDSFDTNLDVFSTNDDTEDESEEDHIKKVTPVEFWKATNTGYKIDFLGLKSFLQDNGFYRYELDDKNFIFVKVIENTIQEVDVRHIKDFVLRCLSHWDKPGVYNMIAENTKFKKEYINYLDPLKIKWNKDCKHYAWLYFKNVAVRTSASEIRLVEYIDLDGFIWRSQKINRNFTMLKREQSNLTDFSAFVNNVCAKDENRIKSFRSAIGYLMHGHKSKSTVKAVVLNDEIIADDAMGGSGKGLTMQVIGTVKNLVIIPGADFDTGKDFAWQRINFDTDIVLIDDVERNFKYKKLFTFLTDGWPVRKLYQSEIFMTPEESPKIVINTNYVLKGDTDSYARRKFELELHPFYNKRHQPIDDFKKEFISEWNEYEANVCDNYLVYCLKDFLHYGLVEPTYVNLQYKKLVMNTSEDFVSFATEYLVNDMKFNKRLLFKYYKELNGLGTYDYPNQKVFTQWSEYWAQFHKYQYQPRAGTGGNYLIIGTGADEWRCPNSYSNNADIIF